MVQCSISLVCMPWHQLGSPSIQLGTLHALLARSGIACRSHSVYLDFLRAISESGPKHSHLTIDEYGAICSQWMNVGAGDWVFAVPGVRRVSPDSDREMLELFLESGMSRELADKLRRVRDRVPTFLDTCADEILAGDPAVVGMTLVYSQSLPSAALASVLRARAPDLKIVVGGASCEGPMGPALLRAFPQFDAAVRGEAESVLV